VTGRRAGLWWWPCRVDGTARAPGARDRVAAELATLPEQGSAPRTSTQPGGHSAKNAHRAGLPATHDE